MRPYADLFFMGAAFLLLETKNIATFALLFGTTWLVNAMVFAGVLVIVLAAVETTRTVPNAAAAGGVRRRSRRRWRLLLVVQPDWLLALPFWPRLIGGDPAGVPADLPGERGVLQAVRQQSDDSQAAFGVNLLGAILGGCLEYAALLTGYRNLLLVVAVLYLVAFLLKPKDAVALTPGVRSA